MRPNVVGRWWEAMWGAGGTHEAGEATRRARPHVAQAGVPIVSERIATAVTYARKRDIRRRHSLSIGAWLG